MRRASGSCKFPRMRVSQFPHAGRERLPTYTAGFDPIYGEQNQIFLIILCVHRQFVRVSVDFEFAINKESSGPY